MGIRCRRSLATACLMLAAAACSGDDDGGASPVITDPPSSSSTTERSTTTSTSTTVDPQADVKAEVEAAYLAYVDAYLEIFSEPNPSNPLIEQHTTGEVREVTLDAVSRNILDGTSTRAPESPDDFKATVLSVVVNGSQADAEVCLVDGSLLVENTTGNVLNDVLATIHVDAKLIVEDGRWKVAESNIIERREGRWLCAD